MTAKWNRCTGFFSALEGIAGLILIVLGIIFERNRGGTLFSSAQQERFAHLVLSYGCLLLTWSCVFSCLVLQTFRGFLLLTIGNALLGGISIAWGAFVILKPLSVLQHGFIEIYLKTVINSATELPELKIKWLKYVFGGIAGLHGIGLLLHSLATFIKRRRVKPQFLQLQQKSAALVDAKAAKETEKQSRLNKKQRNKAKLSPPQPPDHHHHHQQAKGKQFDDDDDCDHEVDMYAQVQTHIAHRQDGDREFSLSQHNPGNDEHDGDDAPTAIALTDNEGNQALKRTHITTIPTPSYHTASLSGNHNNNNAE